MGMSQAKDLATALRTRGYLWVFQCEQNINLRFNSILQSNTTQHSCITFHLSNHKTYDDRVNLLSLLSLASRACQRGENDSQLLYSERIMLEDPILFLREKIPTVRKKCILGGHSLHEIDLRLLNQPKQYQNHGY